MSTEPLAEVYEALKLARRRGQWPTGPQVEGTGCAPRLPQEVLDQLEILLLTYSEFVDGRPGSDQTAILIRLLDIRTLADRVFGDKEKAETWLQRPNVSLSGQKPIDLLQDELGANVVRETLEQIDSGIFA